MNLLARGAGNVLGGVFGAAARLRRTKPLHPKGAVVAATVERTGSGRRWGVPWLDEPGSDAGFVRLSRSLGLPAALPDILGMALRILDADGPHDLLLASSGVAPGPRFLLLPRRQPGTTYGSLFPYRTPAGNVLLSAMPTDDPLVFGLYVASPLGPWDRFGTLRLEANPSTSSDALVDLDPVVNPLPGLALAPAFAALREPSYAAARRGRPDTT